MLKDNDTVQVTPMKRVLVSSS